MLHLYAGFPAAIEFLRVLRDDRRTSAPRGRRAVAGTRDAWRARGERLCRRVYGDGYSRLRRFTRALHPELDAWMIEDGYGKTLARPGLGVKQRELATVAVLAALGWEPQLEAHRAGARRVGASARAVDQAVAVGVRIARGRGA